MGALEKLKSEEVIKVVRKPALFSLVYLGVSFLSMSLGWFFVAPKVVGVLSGAALSFSWFWVIFLLFSFGSIVLAKRQGGNEGKRIYLAPLFSSLCFFIPLGLFNSVVVSVLFYGFIPLFLNLFVAYIGFMLEVGRRKF